MDTSDEFLVISILLSFCNVGEVVTGFAQEHVPSITRRVLSNGVISFSKAQSLCFGSKSGATGNMEIFSLSFRMEHVPGRTR
jgi:hypothetical protein